MRALIGRIALVFLCLSWATSVLAQRAQNAATAPAAVDRPFRISGTFQPADGQAAAFETVTLTIYVQEVGGIPLWQETQSVAIDSEGRYAVLLGSTSSEGLPVELLATGEPRWLGLQFQRPGETEQARTLVTSVPYALMAARAVDADTLGGRPASAYQLASPTAGTAQAAGTVAGGAGISTVAGGTGATPAAPSAGVAATVPAQAAGMTRKVTSGTTGAIGKFVNGTDLGDSVLFENGGKIGLGTTTPQDFMHMRFTDGGGVFTGYAVQNLSGAAAAFSGMLFFDQNGALAQFQGFNNATHEYRINNIASGGTINFMLGSSSKFKVAANGSVGIGTSNPTKAKVEIAGFVNNTIPGINALYISTGTALLISPSVLSYSLYGDSDIAASAFVAFSDERIKRIDGRSDAARDLAILAGIEVTDYAYIDTVARGTGKQKKVIAQQLERVYPLAVSRSTDVVPDIYRKTQIKDGWVMLATDLKKGERVRLIGKQKEGVHEVLDVAPGRFRTDFAADGETVFVFGREVKDFRNVDYDAIAMLNVSATQELHRRLEKQVAEFATQAAELTRQAMRIAELEQDGQAQLARIGTLEKQASELAMLKQQVAQMVQLRQSAISPAGAMAQSGNNAALVAAR